MKLIDAQLIGQSLVGTLAPFCLPEKCVIAGGTRRGKAEVHDLEIVCQPDLSMKPRVVFGMKGRQVPLHRLGQVLDEMEEQDLLFFKEGKDRNRKYWINLPKFGLPDSEGFLLDLFLVMPPAQFGVQLVIRTGPNSEEDKFSKWVVTPRARGGALPDGYCVAGGAVWRLAQTKETPLKRIPLPGEIPLLMPTEEDFLRFLEVDAAPADRHAQWKKYAMRGER